jgi:hypothetical protein
MTAPPTPPTRPADLQRIGRYRIVRPLSKGGMALVYEARRESIAGVAPQVAIKLILPEHAGSATFRDLFINEARLGASMQHQNLVQIQDFDSDGDRFFLVMEYVEGLTLRRVISLCTKHKIRIPLAVIAELGRQSCDGLHYAHQAKDEHGRHLRLVHRDIKPSNLIFSASGVLKILDFGISKGVLREERRGSVKGTWGYMAPEQAHGLDVAPASDVFGLAIVLYELATLKPMFRGKAQDEIRRLLKDDHAARMSATMPREYAALVPVLVRALQRDPSARHQTAEDFGRALSEMYTDPVTAHKQTVAFYSEMQALADGGVAPGHLKISSAAAADTVLAAVSEIPAAPARRAKMSRGRLAVLALLIGVLGGIGWLLWQQDQRINPHATRSAPPLSAEEPAGPAGAGAPGEREAPIRQEKVVRVAIDRTKPPTPQQTTDEAPKDNDQPVVDMETGDLSISSIQPGSEVYINGQFVQKVPVKESLQAGEYDISIIAPDGRRKSFQATVEPGAKTRKVWDFDRGGWR